MTMYGWCGKIARINLCDHTWTMETVDPEILKKFIGGRGLAGYYLGKKITLNWDDPEMPLLIFTGPLVNTRSPTSGRMTIMSRSPLTGTVGDSSVGGSFGTELKKAGFDGIIITGKSHKLSGIEIMNDSIHVTDASHLAGRQTGYVHSLLKSKGSVAVIGPAAENGVVFSSIMVDR
jgi:aldehyde:ferredoxin oxidoreductase